MSLLAYKKAERQYRRTTRNREVSYHDWTPFRAAEKKYKAQFPPPDLSRVLDLGVIADHDLNIPLKRIRTLNGTSAYALQHIPGLVLLPSFLGHEKQKELIKWALCDQARSPNVTNLDTHYHLPPMGLWNTLVASEKDPSVDQSVQPRTAESSSAETNPGPRQLINNLPATSTNFDTFYQTPKPDPSPSPNVQPSLCSKLIFKLRWANIGWFYHWGTKQYDFTRRQDEVDSNLRAVCQSAVATVDWEDVYGDSDSSDWGEAADEWKTWNETYEPDAGIVNFYQIKDTLMGHVDRSEVCATSPLVSISLGNTAVFLIGGLTRDTEPTAILLRSGDVLIMSGPSCRRAYHGVPRILTGTLPPHLDGHGDWKPYADYMATTRININVRQVFPKGFNPLGDRNGDLIVNC